MRSAQAHRGARHTHRAPDKDRALVDEESLLHRGLLAGWSGCGVGLAAGWSGYGMGWMRGGAVAGWGGFGVVWLRGGASCRVGWLQGEAVAG